MSRKSQTQTGNTDAGARQDAVYSQSNKPKSVYKPKSCRSQGCRCGGIINMYGWHIRLVKLPTLPKYTSGETWYLSNGRIVLKTEGGD